MPYEASNPGAYEPAQAGKPYRALKLQSNAAAVDLVVDSLTTAIPLHLEPGEVVTGTATIVSGTLTGVLGYARIPHAGSVL